MLKRKSTNHTIAWFADQYRAKRLELAPDYQRELVWSDDYKRYFIDTILRNYPSPAIFLHVDVSTTGLTNYNVVDGKQRLMAIFDFIEGEFALSKKYGDDFAAKDFNDLPEDVKQEFWQYDMPVQELTSASKEALNEAFTRLNRNVARLNKQELRHAAYSGEFVQRMENLVIEPFWGDIGISNRTTARRMKDTEYVSEIFLLTMHGIQDGTQSKIIDEYYKKYDQEIPEEETHMRKYRACIRIFENLGVEKLKQTRFGNLSDFYSLWAAFLPYTDNTAAIDTEITLANIINFDLNFSEYIKEPQGEKYLDSNFPVYYDNVRQGVNKASNRAVRADILRKLIRVRDDNS